MQDPSPDLHASLARGDLEATPVSDAERALLGYTRKVTEHANRTTDADVEGLRVLGWTDPPIAECVYVPALFAFFNRVADAFGLGDPNSFGNPPPRGGEPAAEGDLPP